MFAPIFTARPGRSTPPASPSWTPPPSSLPRLGRRRRPERRHPTCRGRPQPLRQGPVGPDRRAVDPRRHLPAALGPARSPAASRGRQTPEPPARRADDVHLRDHGTRRRPGPIPHRVRYRTRQPRTPMRSTSWPAGTPPTTQKTQRSTRPELALRPPRATSARTGACTRNVKTRIRDGESCVPHVGAGLPRSWRHLRRRRAGRRIRCAGHVLGLAAGPAGRCGACSHGCRARCWPPSWPAGSGRPGRATRARRCR